MRGWSLLSSSYRSTKFRWETLEAKVGRRREGSDFICEPGMALGVQPGGVTVLDLPNERPSLVLPRLPHWMDEAVVLGRLRGSLSRKPTETIVSCVCSPCTLSGEG